MGSRDGVKCLAQNMLRRRVPSYQVAVASAERNLLITSFTPFTACPTASALHQG